MSSEGSFRMTDQTQLIPFEDYVTATIKAFGNRKSSVKQRVIQLEDVTGPPTFEEYMTPFGVEQRERSTQLVYVPLRFFYSDEQMLRWKYDDTRGESILGGKR
jgi:hypothetical protein